MLKTSSWQKAFPQILTPNHSLHPLTEQLVSDSEKSSAYTAATKAWPKPVCVCGGGGAPLQASTSKGPSSEKDDSNLEAIS